MNQLTEILNKTSTNDVLNQHVFTYNTLDLRSSETISGSALPATPALPEETRDYAYNAVNQLLSVTNPNLTFVYDDDGNMIQGYVNPLLGGAGVGFPFTATYDAEDRMTSLEYTDSSSVVHRTEYQYSGDGFLAVIRKFENSSLVDKIRIVRDGLLAVQERDENNTVLREYTWGLNLGGGIGGLLNMKQAGQDYAYLYDGKGNVAAVLDVSQNVVAAYRYAPFGELLAKTGSLTQPFGFSTKRYDSDTGLVYYGHRYYSSAIGRWTTRDPLGEAGSMNLYAFVGNNPVNWVDPWGDLMSSGTTLTNAIWYKECHELVQKGVKKNFPGDGRDREHHCYASCVYTRCIMKKSLWLFPMTVPTTIFWDQAYATFVGGVVREFKPNWKGWKQDNKPLFFQWGIKDAIGDIGLNAYGITLSYEFWKSCKELCTGCPRLDNWR